MSNTQTLQVNVVDPMDFVNLGIEHVLFHIIKSIWFVVVFEVESRCDRVIISISQESLQSLQKNVNFNVNVTNRETIITTTMIKNK